MSMTVRRVVSATVAVAIVVFAAATVLFPVRSSIGGPIGIAFWIGLALMASALPVRLPHGVVANVSIAPVIASIALGGPVAAGIVAFVGTTDMREVRRDIPWYGTLFNHTAIVVAAVAGGLVYDTVLRTVDEPP